MSLAAEASRLAVDEFQEDWHLAWLLAHDICRRFYRSHGIVPRVLEHEGIGYYGIALDLVGCGVNGQSSDSLGRITAFGDVENWQRPKRDRMALHCVHVAPRGYHRLVSAAVEFLELPALPATSHVGCRHQRWGASYELCFEVAAIIAIRTSRDEMEIWNHPWHIEGPVRKHDPDHNMKEHPGAFLFRFVGHEKAVLLRGDGRLLGSSRTMDLWLDYMSGASPSELADQVMLDLVRPSE